ncbi:copper amine oxidase N-terminal domain-containing protein [Lysinibacillus yapensis]|uniref:Copper amine oxidase N-terminal domain-containing protein n=1 Tax=Ureibacillus yapensis TaxID=2304605 RepID=A0A396S6S9_9BACL|nr:copper amine oxidase N-terminal domain-containing protein [Lysinibacillus yapensis]RHW36203.1 copper amine oxidase N-terminal domain-containing protein [Lysinibacillus yapensis]
MLSKFNKLLIVSILIASSLLLLNQDKTFAAQRIGNGLYIKNNVTVMVNGERVTFNDPILNKNGQLFLPMRDFYEIIGATVYWNQKTKTASAERNGNRVDVTLNSRTAKLNGETVTVNVPPFLYKYKTYVPIRFLSEKLGGTVKWNQQAQRVDITVGNEVPSPSPEPVPTPIKDPYYLHINDKRIAMADPIITKGGRSYIPAEYFYENLENSSGKWLTKDQFELQISGLIFVFTNGSSTIKVNDESVATDEQPFTRSGKMYVPVKFIVNAVGDGGNLRYLSKQKEMYIYLYQYMFTSKFLEKSYGSTKVPQNTPNAELSGNRTLLVSDNPETLTAKVIPNSTATLSEQIVKSSESVNEHRVFGWHYNTLGKNIALGITVENTSQTTSLQVAKSQGVFKRSGHSWINYDIGLPIADHVLNDKLQQAESEGITIAPGETKVIQMYTLSNSYIIGFLHDLDIQAVNGGESSYTIRTVLAKNNEDLSTIHSEVVPINPYAAHPRGVWPSSTIVSEFPTYTIGDAEAGYSISNGKTDHFLTAESSLEQRNGALGNSGHFGINYIVNIPVANPSGQPQKVRLKLSGRGGLYSGAIKVNGQVHLIPTLKPGKEYIELPSYTINGTNEVITIEVMHAGGSNLPMAIYIETE